MRKITVLLSVLFITARLNAFDLGNNLSVSGGVKAGFQIKNSDYAGKLEGISRDGEYPVTFFFASRENDAYNGEGWFGLGYNAGDWGLKVGAWSHGDIKKYEDTIHLGDHYFWANFFDKRLRLVGGQGGGTEINSGGWINADWLSYTGLRLFWVDYSGLRLGINFTAPEPEGVKPADYLSTIMFGAKYDTGIFRLSFIVNNSPVYDDSEANYDGGLHDRGGKIGQAGNIAFGAGATLLDKRLSLDFDGMVTNIGEEDVPTESSGAGDYKISPVETTLALKGGFSFTEKLYGELKGKCIINSGDNADDTGTTTWGRFVIEPYAGYQMFDFVKLQFSFNLTWYINSYYLAVDANPGRALKEGQVPAYPWALDYFSRYQLTLEPSIVFSVFDGGTIVTGYKGNFSRDHVENSIYVDFRWEF